MQTSRPHSERTETGTPRPSRGRTTARRETPGAGAAVPPPLTADVLRAVQRGAGNAAATGMIARRARPAPAPQQSDTGVQDVLRSSGRPLAGPVRQDMESRFGTDFSDVRLHTGAAAARSARAIGARAYTSGSHVVIGDGGGDQHTLAHELTHVVQQRNGPVSGAATGHGFAMSDPGDRFERAAEANAHRVMSGPAPDVQRLAEADGDATPQAADTVQRASTTVLENATVTHYQPSKANAARGHDLVIQRPRTVTGPINPTGTAGRPAAPNPIAVKRLHAAYRNQNGARGAPSEPQVWKDLFGGAGYDRGHVMGLEVGGSDVTENIVPQWSLNQGTGMWRRIEQEMVGVGTGTLRFEVTYGTANGNYRRVMIPEKIDIYLNNAVAAYRSWENEPDINDQIRAGRDPGDLAQYYTEAKDELSGRTTLTEDQMQLFAVQALARDRATSLSYQDYEDLSAQGQAPTASTADTHMQGMTRSTFPKDRRDKLIQSYVDAGWVTRSGTGASATYTLGDVPAPAADSDTESSSQSSDSDEVMSDGSQQASPGQPFATIQFDSQGSSSDEDYEDRMSIGS
ncbi:DUF4157 domain-containing protein [Streptomyces sp. CRN 30]|uniref:eCIS core domain-containing protein n=1 Tax=Streptomyces sp. CRN 30 TaxID=3075613 RepID=UPI002A822D6B|nr:DUF4157 domain-containing protein [Streptomyces sp. CRN 30]